MDQYRDTVGFAMSTWRKVKAFQEGLRNLEQRLPMHEVRDYLASGRREEGVPAERYDEIDRLNCAPPASSRRCPTPLPRPGPPALLFPSRSFKATT